LEERSFDLIIYIDIISSKSINKWINQFKKGVFLLTKDLLKVFQLEKHKDLVRKSLKPKSLGGTDEFKILARKGDLILDEALTELFKGITTTGNLNKLMTSIHNENCLIRLGIHLKIDQYFLKAYSSNSFSNTDIKEAIEVLIYISSTVNNLELINEIVEKLYEIIKKNNFFEINYKNILQEHYQSNTSHLPEYIPIDAGGPDHVKHWQSKIKDEFFGTDKEYISDLFSKIIDAEQDVAYKFLRELDLINNKILSIKQLNFQDEKITKIIKQSVHLPEIVFSLYEIEDSKKNISLTTNTGEFLIDWFNRKRKKNPFSALLLLSARLDEISYTCWFASLVNTELILINLKINENNFFELAVGETRTKAKKEAGSKVIEKSELINWLLQFKKNEQI